MNGVKLWLDDIRPQPDDSWIWAKSVEQAKIILAQGDVQIASLDHDLGGQFDPNIDYDPRDPEEIPWHYAGSQPGADGIDLVKWLCEHPEYMPSDITIHSWNPDGAENMRKTLQDVGVSCVVAPFTVPR